MHAWLLGASMYMRRRPASNCLLPITSAELVHLPACTRRLLRHVRVADASVACAGDNRQPKRYIPFAEGPRNCVGQSLAKVSLVATMALLLARFSFRLADDVSLPPPHGMHAALELLADTHTVTPAFCQALSHCTRPEDSCDAGQCSPARNPSCRVVPALAAHVYRKAERV